MCDYTKKLEKWKEDIESVDDLEERKILYPKPVITPMMYEAKAMEEMMKSYCRTIIKDKLEKGLMTEEQPFLQKQYNLAQEIKKNKKPFYFITINPKPDSDFKDFIKCVKSVWNWSWINKLHYSIEQRSDNIDEAGKGFHAHFILEDFDNEKGKITKQFTTKFQPFCSPPYKNTINIQEKKKEWLKDKIDYIKGFKLDEGKPEKVEVDKLWRKKENIEDYYSFDSLTDKKESNCGGARKGSGRKKAKK